ncbi:hypothetical protein F320042A7_01440 [Blautia producta]
MTGRGCCGCNGPVFYNTGELLGFPCVTKTSGQEAHCGLLLWKGKMEA